MFSFFFQTRNKNVIRSKVLVGMLRFILLVVMAHCAVRADDAGPMVCFEKRCVRGKTFKGNVKEFEGFLGIPYAKPPVGELRLKVSSTTLT